LPQYGVRNLNAIVINYLTCFILGSTILGEIPVKAEMLNASWFPYAIFLSLIFIIFFNVNAYTIQKVGMIITSVFQKLSLIAPFILGLILFNEEGSLAKYIAIVLTVIAIVLINLPNKQKLGLEDAKKYWYWPLLVLFGSGLIECTLFYAQETGKVNDAGIDFVTTLFFGAGCWGLVFILLSKKWFFSLRDIIAGILIGIPNFFTIYLLIRGLELGWDGSVLFPVNNVGVIFFTAIIGILIFKERLSGLNYLGLVLALVSVALISI